MTSPLRSVLGLGLDAFAGDDADEPDPAHRDTDPAPPLECDDIVHDTSHGRLLAAFPLVRAKP